MEKYPVQFVGAGPGDPELITVKGAKALEKADLIIYAGSLVPEPLLHWGRKDAEKLSSAEMHLEEIIQRMFETWQAGKKVVRLHSGDPSLYGAIFEQMRALREKNVSFEIIPGVSAAFAAAAALRIEYTIPEICQTLVLTRAEGRTPVPETEDLKALAEHKAAMAIYLSSGLAEKVQDVLEETYGQDAAVAVVYRASHPDELIIRTTVSELAESMRDQEISRQALIIIGAALEELSLSGKQPASKLYDQKFSHGFRKGTGNEE